MAINPKAAALAVLLGTSAAAGIGWAQTAAPTPPASDATAAQDAPAADTTAETNIPAATDTTATTGTSGTAEAAADTATPPTEPDAAAAPGADAAADAANAQAGSAPAGQGAPAAPAASRDAAQVGQYYVDSNHGEWTLRCIKAPEGPDLCELYQLLQDSQGNSVAEFSVIPLTGKAAAGATVVAPLETDLVAGLGLKVDSGELRGYPFNFCAPVGCVARIGFTQAEVDGLKRGNSVTVTLLPYGAEPGQKVDLPLSLKGFTAGFDAVAKKMPAPEAKTE